MASHGIGTMALLRKVYDVPEPEQPKPRPAVYYHQHTLQELLANTTLNHTTGCMEWDSSRNPKTGYAQLYLNFDGRHHNVHRLVAFFSHIKHPEWRMYLMNLRWIHVCHTCDNPPCINPEHLVIATARYNTWDSFVKDRRNGRLLRPSTVQAVPVGMI
jgi:hypothetical protein